MENCRERYIPLLASPHHRKGGVAERPNKYREASADREDGVVFRWKRKENHPVCIKLRWLRDIFLMMQPPLLAVMQGGESRSMQLPVEACLSYRVFRCAKPPKLGEFPCLQPFGNTLKTHKG